MRANNYNRSVRSASFGGAAVVGALLYVSGIPRVQQDVLQVCYFRGTVFVVLSANVLLENPLRWPLLRSARSPPSGQRKSCVLQHGIRVATNEFPALLSVLVEPGL